MRIKTVEKSNNLTSKGLEYALSYSASGLKSFASQFELLRSDLFICKLAQELINTGEKSTRLDEVKRALGRIMEELTKNSGIEISVHGQDKNGLFDKLNAHLNKMWTTVGKNNNNLLSPMLFVFAEHPRKHIFKIPQTVNYCVDTRPISPLVEDAYGKYFVLGQLLTHSFLHREIREGGGAYAGGVQVDKSGLFSFYSYRDPNLEETFEKYNQSLEYASKGNFTNQDIVDAKIVAFQGIDRAKDPANDGLEFFKRNVNADQLNRVRKNILSTTREDLIQSAKYLEKSKSSKTVFSMSELKEENKLRKEVWEVFDLGMLGYNKDNGINI